MVQSASSKFAVNKLADEAELEAFARARMARLCHKVRFKIEGSSSASSMGRYERDRYRLAFSAFCPTMMRPTSCLSG